MAHTDETQIDRLLDIHGSLRVVGRPHAARASITACTVIADVVRKYDDRDDLSPEARAAIERMRNRLARWGQS